MADAEIRAAEAHDLPDITRIYNHYVVETPVTFDIEPYSVDERRPWFEQFGLSGRYRLLVAVDRDRVLGYAGTMRFRPKAAYDTTVETTIYLDPQATGRGLGARLYAALFEAIASEDIHQTLGGVTLPNDASLALHRRFGFRSTGVLHEVGRKFGRYWDVEWFEKTLG